MIHSLVAGCFIILAFIVLINPPAHNTKAKYWFSGFLLCVGLGLAERDLYQQNPDFVVVSECSRFLIAPFLYFSIVYFTKPKFVFSIYSFLHFIPFVIFSFFAIVFLIQHEYPLSLPKPISRYLGYFLSLSLKLQILIYWVYSFLLLRKHRKNVQLFSTETNQVNLNWLMNLLYIILVIIVIAILSAGFSHLLIFPYLPIIYCLCSGFIAYYIIPQKEIYPFPETVKTEIQEIIEVTSSKKSPIARLSEAEMAFLKTKLELIMEQDKPYLQSDINLFQLAEYLNISTHDLSFLLNTGLSVNFNDYINNYRINEAKRLLRSPKHTHLSIEGIGYESGFSSKSSFFTSFKKIVGLSPLAFKKVDMP